MSESQLLEPEALSSQKDLGGKYLAFELGRETYGFEIFKIQEILGLMTITKVPYTSQFIKGVVNLRGKVIPVMDLRVKFGLESKEYNDRTCIIVIKVKTNIKEITMGIIVDEVSEVLDIAHEDIEDTPNFGDSINTRVILGLGKVGEKVVVLLEVDQILQGNEVTDIADMKGIDN